MLKHKNFLRGILFGGTLIEAVGKLVDAEAWKLRDNVRVIFKLESFILSE